MSVRMCMCGLAWSFMRNNNTCKWQICTRLTCGRVHLVLVYSRGSANRKGMSAEEFKQFEFA